MNDALSSAKFKRFLLLKDIARDLYFKYIWHRAGKFLIRRGDKDRRVHVIETVADLSANTAAYRQIKHRHCMNSP